MGGLSNPRPWRGRCRAGYSNTGGPPLPRKRAPLQKNSLDSLVTHSIPKSDYFCSKIRCEGVNKVQKCVANMNFLFLFHSLLSRLYLTLLCLHTVEVTIRDLTGFKI